MKCSILGWLLGLPLLALIWGLAVKAERTPIIQDLQQRSQAALQRADLDWARVQFNATEGQLSGAAYSKEGRARALDIVRRTWGVWSLADSSQLIEEAPNYIWGAAVRDDRLHLTGYVPSERARRQILKVAKERFPQHAVRDSMRPARGAPGRGIWVDGISFGLRQLGQLKKGGRVDLNGNRLGVAGEATSVTAYRTIKGDFSRRLPNGILLAQDKVTPPSASPFKWRASYKAGQVEISGHVPPGKVRDEIVTIATEAFPKAAIVYKMTAAGGAPTGWLKAVSIVLRGMSKLKLADAEISDQQIKFTGLAIKEATSERIASSLQVGMPDDYKLKHRIRFEQATLPTVSPFTTTMKTDGERVSLTGFAPDERRRQRLVSTAKNFFPKREIVDALTYANGAPAGWLTCANAGVLGLSRLDKGRAELSDTLLRLMGETRNEKSATGLPAEVRAAANRACKDTIEIIVKTPPEPNLMWQARSSGERIELSGEVIDSNVKALILKNVARLFPKRKIVDGMRINPGRSEKWAKVVRLGLEQLAKLRSGLVRLNGQVLTLEGVAPDTAVSTQVKSRMKRGVTVGYSGRALIEVKSDAMIWSEQEAKRKSEATATNQRRKATQAERATALLEVQRRAAKAAARARVATEERERRKAQAVQEAARQARAKVEIATRRRADTEVERWLAAQAAARRQQVRLRRRIKKQAEQKRESRALAEQCKNELNKTAEQGSIRFEVGSNRLSGASTSTLDKLIKTYRGCPGARLEIGGHTDSSGSEASNLRLSQRRAEAVLEYFAERGLPRDKFVARGYGETRPRVSNNSAADRARNRRIEFDVLSN